MIFWMIHSEHVFPTYTLILVEPEFEHAKSGSFVPEPEFENPYLVMAHWFQLQPILNETRLITMRSQPIYNEVVVFVVFIVLQLFILGLVIFNKCFLALLKVTVVVVVNFVVVDTVVVVDNVFVVVMLVFTDQIVFSCGQ